MKPLLASLVLLLLALCRSSAHLSYKVVSHNTQASTSVISLATSPAQSQTVTKKLGSSNAGDLTDDQKDKLLDKAGNLLFLLGFVAADVIDKIPEFLLYSLFNGVLCDAEDSDYNTLMNTVMPAFTGERLQKYRTAATSIKVDCTKLGSPPSELEKCVCIDTDKSPLICTGIYWKQVSLDPKQAGTFKQKPCRKDALDTLVKSGEKVLGPTYDLDGFDKKSGIKEVFAGDVAGIDAITDNGSDEATKFFCDALDPKVEEAVAGLFAADGMYWFADALILTIAFGPAEKDLPTACKSSEFSSNPYGKCVCKMNTGFSFCIYKALAELFQTAGYLECKTKKFVPDKKPTALPQIAPKKGSAAATAFSLVTVTLVAAAALFTRH